MHIFPNFFPNRQIIFNSFFYLEAAIKMRTYGYNMYYHDEWRRFEWMLVLIAAFEQSRIAFFVSEHIYPLPPLLLRLLPALRALRTLRLVHGSLACEFRIAF